MGQDEALEDELEELTQELQRRAGLAPHPPQTEMGTPEDAAYTRSVVWLQRTAQKRDLLKRRLSEREMEGVTFQPNMATAGRRGRATAGSTPPRSRAPGRGTPGPPPAGQREALRLRAQTMEGDRGLQRHRLEEQSLESPSLASHKAAYANHVGRQEAARMRREERERKANASDLAITHWKPRVTTPKPFNLSSSRPQTPSRFGPGTKEGGARGESGGGADGRRNRSMSPVGRGGQQRSPSPHGSPSPHRSPSPPRPYSAGFVQASPSPQGSGQGMARPAPSPSKFKEKVDYLEVEVEALALRVATLQDKALLDRRRYQRHLREVTLQAAADRERAEERLAERDEELQRVVREGGSPRGRGSAANMGGGGGSRREQLLEDFLRRAEYRGEDLATLLQSVLQGCDSAADDLKRRASAAGGQYEERVRLFARQVGAWRAEYDDLLSRPPEDLSNLLSGSPGGQEGRTARRPISSLSVAINARARDLLWRMFQVLDKVPGRTPDEQGVNKSELVLSLMRLADAKGPGSAERMFALDEAAPAGEFKAFCEALERDHPERVITWDALAVYFAFCLEEPGGDPGHALQSPTVEEANGEMSPGAEAGVGREERLARLGVVRAKVRAASAFSVPPRRESAEGFSGAQRAKVRSVAAFRSSSPEGGDEASVGAEGFSGAQRAKVRSVSAFRSSSPEGGDDAGVDADADQGRRRSPHASLRVKTQAVVRLNRTASGRQYEAQEDVSDIPVDPADPLGSPTASAGSPPSRSSSRRALGKMRAVTALSQGGRRESGSFGDGSPRSPEVASDSFQDDV